MKKIRTRFAPSPTGYLHIGSLRMALFIYLLAKSSGGNNILRIEDTDQKRLVEGAQENLIKILEWIGITFDEGPHVGGNFGPYVQSERKSIYHKHLKELINKGEAYYCFCTPERLQEMREGQQAKKLPPRYDRTCRNLSNDEISAKIKAGEKYVIRQKMPESGKVVVVDELRGEISFKAEELEDHVLIKTDGMPTYQFAVVVDDHEMEITHVFRGEEWIPSFPKNILLYKSFGWTPPKFIHVPLTLNKGGGKLSKRQGDVAVEDFKKNGYLVEALINFSALLGWHPKNDNEILNIDQLIKEFNYKDMGISPSIFDIEKLDYLNGYYIRHKNIEELVDLCMPYLENNLLLTDNPKKKSNEYIKKIVFIEQERLKKLSDISEITKFFFMDDLKIDQELLAWKKMTVNEAKVNLEKIYSLLDKIPDENWTNDSIEDDIMTYLRAKELKVGEYLWPMRVALTGEKASPGPFDVAEILGKAETLERIMKVIK